MPDEVIPESLRLAAEEIAAVCRKYRMDNIQATIRPGFDTQVPAFTHDVQLTWTSGRHYAAESRASLIYTRRVVVAVAEPVMTPP